MPSLLQPRLRDSHKTQVLAPKTQCNKDGFNSERKDEKIELRAMNHIYISPALYITPEPTPIPETSTGSVSPSPYVVNHKRRRGGREAFANRKCYGLDEAKVSQQNEVSEESHLSSGSGGGGGLVAVGVKFVEDKSLGFEVNGKGIVEVFDEEESGGLFESRCDVKSVGSGNDVRGVESRSYVSALGEFFDANEDFSSEGSASNIPSCGTNVESELRAMRRKLLDEIERRKTAEDALNLMRLHWQSISDVLSKEGLTLPLPSDVIGGMQLENDSIEQLSCEIGVVRYVAETIGKGQAREAAELAAEAIFESKNQEISRLRDRLQYYKAVNHEMSQRNQEIIDVARRQRQRKRTQWKWLWRGMGLSASIGISVVAYSYLPETSKYQPLSSPSDVTDVGTSKT